MSGLLIETCGPSLISSYSYSSPLPDWRQQPYGSPGLSASSFCRSAEGIRPALASQFQVPRKPSSGHDHKILIAAKQPLQLYRELSSSKSASKEIKIHPHIDGSAMSEDDQRQSRRKIPPKGSKQSQGWPPKDSITSPTSSTSAKSMPTPRLTFTEVTTQADNASLEEEDDEEELSGTPSDAEDDSATGSTAKTAAERLAEKRKMKRFRLTHSQTRFLMSEFSRQPHPDAAQRERLSRDIPGLSPRQVQVWFQNRRAKMKRLTGDDQERMMRSRALPTGFDLSRTLRPATSEQLQSPSALAHFVGPNTNLTGVNPIGRPVSRSDGRDVPPINMALVYRNASYSMGSAGESSNVSPSTSIHSANQSPMFAASPNSSPFLRAAGDGFPRTFNPANLGFPAQANSRSRSGSLMNLAPTSPLSGGSPLAYPRESLSMENIHTMYHTQYSGGNQESGSLNPHLGGVVNIPVHSPSILPNQGHPSAADLAQRNSSSAMPGTVPESNVEGNIESSPWFSPSSNQQLPRSDHQFQAHQIRRRQTQPTHPTRQYRPSGIATLSPTTQTPSSFSSTMYPQSRQPSPIQQMTPYAPSTAFPTGPSFMGSPTIQQPTTNDRASPADVYHSERQQQQQSRSYQQDSNYSGYSGYYQPPSQ